MRDTGHMWFTYLPVLHWEISNASIYSCCRSLWGIRATGFTAVSDKLKSWLIKNASCRWFLKWESPELQGIPHYPVPHSVFTHIWGETFEEQVGEAVTKFWGSYPQTTDFPRENGQNLTYAICPTHGHDTNCCTLFIWKNCVHSNLVLITPYMHHFLWADIPCLEAVCYKWHFAGGNCPEITRSSCTSVCSGALYTLLEGLLVVTAGNWGCDLWKL